MSTPPNLSSKATDDLFAKAMTELSVQEREQVYHDVHGIFDVAEETSDIITRCLADLDAELNKIQNKHAYELAKRQDPYYVSNRKLLLKFLRSESFAPQRAAEKLVRFFQVKSDLFGESKLTTEIRIADLNEEDIRLLESGLGQLMPRRDQAGRAIFCWCTPLYPPNIRTSMESRMRLAYYMLMLAFDDEETQIKGIVMLLINCGPRRRGADFEFVLKAPSVIRMLPLRIAAAHIIFDSDTLGPVNAAILQAITKTSRVRFRFHQGTALECHYKLMTFGIPTEALPMTNNNEFPLDNHSEWLKGRRQAEREAKGTRGEIITISSPCQNDVLFGRDKFVQHHAGNIHYLRLIDERREEHKNVESKSGKTQIANAIVSAIKERGGRFLKRADAGWAAVDDATARYKVASAIRGMRKSEVLMARRHAAKQSDPDFGNDQDLERVKRPRPTGQE